jgi:hypothetical protein
MKNSPQTYSPFWALAAVFLAFVFLQGMSVANLIKQRSQLEASQAEMQKVIPQALMISQTIENLGHDLLAMTNREARQIVADFKIAPSAQPK